MSLFHTGLFPAWLIQCKLRQGEQLAASFTIWLTPPPPWPPMIQSLEEHPELHAGWGWSVNCQWIWPHGWKTLLFSCTKRNAHKNGISIFRKSGDLHEARKKSKILGRWFLFILVTFLPHFLPPWTFFFSFPIFGQILSVLLTDGRSTPQGKLHHQYLKSNPHSLLFPLSVTHTVFFPLVMLQPRADPNTSFLVFFLLRRPFSHQWWGP